MRIPAENFRELRLQSWRLSHEVSGFVVGERLRRVQHLLAKYNPTQPRVPAGNPSGGEWTSGGGGGAILNVVADSAANSQYPNDAIEPVYPLESLLGAIYFGRALAAVRELSAIWASGEHALRVTDSSEVAKAIEEYLGGAGHTIKNSAGDLVIIRGDKKVRFDIENPGLTKDGLPEDPHFHIEKRMPNGKWNDAGPEHRYYFDKGK